MQFRKTATAVGLAAVTAGAGLAATAVPASAATYGGQCGSGYTVVRSSSVGGSGTAFLAYNASNGKNCVVVVRNSPGTAVPMTARLKLSSESSWQEDSGNYTTYAGPVYRAAAGQCVDWGGSIQNYVVHFENDACN